MSKQFGLRPQLVAWRTTASGSDIGGVAQAPACAVYAAYYEGIPLPSVGRVYHAINGVCLRPVVEVTGDVHWLTAPPTFQRDPTREELARRDFNPESLFADPPVGYLKRLTTGEARCQKCHSRLEDCGDKYRCRTAGCGLAWSKWDVLCRKEFRFWTDERSGVGVNYLHEGANRLMPGAKYLRQVMYTLLDLAEQPVPFRLPARAMKAVAPVRAAEAMLSADAEQLFSRYTAGQSLAFSRAPIAGTVVDVAAENERLTIGIRGDRTVNVVFDGDLVPTVGVGDEVRLYQPLVELFAAGCMPRSLSVCPVVMQDRLIELLVHGNLLRQDPVKETMDRTTGARLVAGVPTYADMSLGLSALLDVEYLDLQDSPIEDVLVADIAANVVADDGRWVLNPRGLQSPRYDLLAQDYREVLELGKKWRRAGKEARGVGNAPKPRKQEPQRKVVKSTPEEIRAMTSPPRRAPTPIAVLGDAFPEAPVASETPATEVTA
jgi:hypothetical protein